MSIFQLDILLKSEIYIGFFYTRLVESQAFDQSKELRQFTI